MKLTLSFLFKLFIFSSSTLGVYLTLKDAAYPIEALSYFTTMINIFTALFYVFFIIELVLRKSRIPLLVFFKQALMAYLVITVIIYSFILIPFIAEDPSSYQIFSRQDVLIHYVVPFSVVVDYILFDEKGKLKSFYPLINGFNIVLYGGYLVTYALLGGRFHFGNNVSAYPYFFLNIEQAGLQSVTLICLSIIALVMFIGWVIYMIDQLISVPLKTNSIKRK
jgi:hypothetical protein